MTENSKHSASEVTLRVPVVSDVAKMAALINSYAGDALMLPRSHNSLYQHLRDFCVLEHGDDIVGCGALQVVWEDSAEIRSLAIAEGWQGMGLGRRLVERLLEEAKRIEVPTVFTLTYKPGFFEAFGFAVVSRDTLPHKIWADCLDCPKFPNCDEIAMTLDLKTKESHDG